MMKKSLAVVFAILFLIGIARAEVTITNLVVVQREGTKIVDITYDIFSGVTNAVSIGLGINDGSNSISSASASGDVASNVPSEIGKAIIWDAGADWDRNVADLLFTVFTYDISIVPSPSAKTGQTILYHTGDDGDLEEGVSWPSPRFVDQGDGTVSDSLTGLIWIKAPHSLPGNSGALEWGAAVDLGAGLAYASYDDWRLPTRREIITLIDYGTYFPALSLGHPFQGISEDAVYWSGTTLSFETNSAWALWFSLGELHSTELLIKTNAHYAWFVRGETEGSSPVSRTGQSVSYRAADDGELQTGVAWSPPRFTDHGDGTVTDNLSGLIWVKNPHALAANLEGRSWNSAVDFCNALDYANHADWRLPNIKELESLVHCGTGSWGNQTFEWMNSTETPFSGVDSSRYWSSTTRANRTGYAWRVDMGYGNVTCGYYGKGYSYRAWPVRGGGEVQTNVIDQTIVNSSVDSQDYKLLVSSLYGTPSPSAGANLYAWSSTVTCSIDPTAIEGLTNWICSGWTGSGSVPVSGDAVNTGSVILTNLNSSIVWNWPVYTANDLWAENVSAVQRAGTKLVDISYDVHSTETNRVAVSLSVDDGAVGSGSVSGDVGADVSTGSGKNLVWDAGADWDRNVDTLSFEILSEDAQGATDSGGEKQRN